jgi:hypothetical protein
MERIMNKRYSVVLFVVDMLGWENDLMAEVIRFYDLLLSLSPEKLTRNQMWDAITRNRLE